MNKKRIVYALVLPICILILVFGIGGFLSSKAGSEDFVVSNGILTKYTGNDTKVKIPSNVTVIGQDAFDGNYLINSVEIPDTVTRIDGNAFSNCTGLIEVIIPDSVKEIGDSAFNSDTSLSVVRIGKGLSTLGSGTFAGCTSLANITFSNPNFICENGCIYNISKKHLYQYLAGYPGNVYNMPDSVEIIERYTFWGADKLNEINLSGSLDKIPEYSMANCPNLMNVKGNLPLREIGLGAFHGDNSLLQVVMPDSMSMIHENAFDGCPGDLIFVCNENSYSNKYATEKGLLVSTEPQVSVTNNNLTISDADTSIYANNNSGNNNSVSNNATNKNDLYGQLFDDESNETNNQSNTTNNEQVYKEPEKFNGYEYIDEPNTTRVAADKAFVTLDNLSVIDGSQIDSNSSALSGKSVLDYEFYNSSIKNYTIDEDITAIGTLSFARSQLESISIPEGVEHIGYAAFYHCDQLSDIHIPSTVKAIEAHAFDYTKWLENWYNNPSVNDYLIVGDGVLVAYKGTPEDFEVPENVKFVCEDVQPK